MDFVRNFPSPSTFISWSTTVYSADSTSTPCTLWLRNPTKSANRNNILLNKSELRLLVGAEMTGRLLYTCMYVCNERPREVVSSLTSPAGCIAIQKSLVRIDSLLCAVVMICEISIVCIFTTADYWVLCKQHC